MEKHAKSASLQWRRVSVAAWVIPAANIIQRFMWRRGKSNFHAFGHWERNQPLVRNTQHVRCLSHTCHWLLRRLQHSSSKTSAVNHQVWDTARHLTSQSAKRVKKKDAQRPCMWVLDEVWVALDEWKTKWQLGEAVWSYQLAVWLGQASSALAHQHHEFQNEPGGFFFVDSK